MPDTKDDDDSIQHMRGITPVGRYGSSEKETCPRGFPEMGAAR
jgi:hypothetical protein